MTVLFESMRQAKLFMAAKVINIWLISPTWRKWPRTRDHIWPWNAVWCCCWLLIPTPAVWLHWSLVLRIPVEQGQRLWMRLWAYMLFDNVIKIETSRATSASRTSLWWNRPSFLLRDLHVLAYTASLLCLIISLCRCFRVTINKTAIRSRDTNEEAFNSLSEAVITSSICTTCVYILIFCALMEPWEGSRNEDVTSCLR